MKNQCAIWKSAQLCQMDQWYGWKWKYSYTTMVLKFISVSFLFTPFRFQSDCTNAIRMWTGQITFVTYHIYNQLLAWWNCKCVKFQADFLGLCCVFSFHFISAHNRFSIRNRSMIYWKTLCSLLYVVFVWLLVFVCASTNKCVRSNVYYCVHYNTKREGEKKGQIPIARTNESTFTEQTVRSSIKSFLSV